MRISLLQKREPFHDVLVQTLRPWWSMKYGLRYDVTWTQSAPSGPAQRWYCNPYLNSIFPEGVDPQVFGPIRSEFAYTNVAWRRPFQSAAVALATRPPLMYVACTSRLQVIPAVPNSRFLLIIPGNHKLRILDWRERMVDVVLKSQYDSTFLSNEIETRAIAKCHGLVVPEISEVIGSAGPNRVFGFREEYVNGVPLNRLNCANDVSRSFAQAVRQVDRLAKATTESCRLRDYTEQMLSEIAVRIRNIPSLSFQGRESLRTCAERLTLEAVTESAELEEIMTVLAHGDFQPANILVEDGKVWLIDWEYSGRRQALYDRLVFHLQSRFPHGLCQRIENFVGQGLPIDGANDHAAKPAANLQSELGRSQVARLFFLEELLLHTQENSNPQFQHVGHGLRQVLREATAWLSRNRKTKHLSCSS